MEESRFVPCDTGRGLCYGLVCSPAGFRGTLSSPEWGLEQTAGLSHESGQAWCVLGLAWSFSHWKLQAELDFPHGGSGAPPNVSAPSSGSLENPPHWVLGGTLLEHRVFSEADKGGSIDGARVGEHSSLGT